MRRIIKIFLASSIVELSKERLEIENFIHRISDSFEEKYDIKIRPLLCENLDDAYSIVRKQEEYNEKIRESHLCFFIFFTKAGEYTREEFEVARKAFEESGKPKIYTYFKVLGENKGEESLYDFVNYLDKVFQHYYGTFEHIDTVKLRILLSLKLQEMEFIDVKVDSGKCFVDGNVALSIENVSEFANNQVIKQLNNDLVSVEEQYYKLKSEYESAESNADICREYAKIATKRQNLIDSIKNLNSEIFNMSLRMCKDEVRGEITLRQKEAYKLFEKGDIEGANKILDFVEIQNEYQRRKAIREAEQKKDAAVYIREIKTKIDILKMLTKISNRFEELEEMYNEITSEAFDNNVELECVVDFINYLYEQNKDVKAIKIAEDLCVLSDWTENAENKTKATLYNTLGLLYLRQQEPEKAQENLRFALNISEKSETQNKKEFDSQLAKSYHNIAHYFHEKCQFQKARKYYLKEIEILETLSKDDDTYANDLATAYSKMGNILLRKSLNDLTGAQKYISNSLKIRKNLAQNSQEEYRIYIGNSYIDMANLYVRLHEEATAEKYFLDGKEIYEEYAITNPEKFKPELVKIYESIGDFYWGLEKFNETESYLLKAINISEELAIINPIRFNDDLARSYSSIGFFYSSQGRADKIDEYKTKYRSIPDNRFPKNNHNSANKQSVAFDTSADEDLKEEVVSEVLSLDELVKVLNIRGGEDIAERFTLIPPIDIISD